MQWKIGNTKSVNKNYCLTRTIPVNKLLSTYFKQETNFSAP